MNKTKQTEQKEIGRVKLSDTQELVASIVDNEKLGLMGGEEESVG